jgi:hypothetical protein
MVRVHITQNVQVMYRHITVIDWMYCMNICNINLNFLNNMLYCMYRLRAAKHLVFRFGLISNKKDITV